MKIRIKDARYWNSTIMRIKAYGKESVDQSLCIWREGDTCLMEMNFPKSRKELLSSDVVDLVKHLARTWPELFEVEP